MRNRRIVIVAAVTAVSAVAAVSIAGATGMLRLSGARAPVESPVGPERGELYTAGGTTADRDAGPEIGGGDGTRTHDPLLAKQVL
jgi:hypothetical protein